MRVWEKAGKAPLLTLLISVYEVSEQVPRGGQECGEGTGTPCGDAG